MRWFIPVLALGAVACPSEDDQANAVEVLQKRVNAIDKRVRTLEQFAKEAKAGKSPAPAKEGKAKAPGPPKDGKAKAPPKEGKAPPAAKAKAKAKAPQGPAPTTGMVRVEGDAKRVELHSGQKRFKVPGPAGAGKYTVMAAWADEEPTPAGEITVVPKKILVLKCTAHDKTCAID